MSEKWCLYRGEGRKVVRIIAESLDGPKDTKRIVTTALEDDAEHIVTAVNHHEPLVNLLRSFESMAADRISDIEVLQLEAETLLADIDKESS